MSSSKESEPEGAVVVDSADDSDLFWLEIGRKAVEKSLEKMDDAAKQLVTVTSLSQTIYFASLAFIFKSVNADKPTAMSAELIVSILILPLLSWIATILFSLNVFMPKKYVINLACPDDAQGMVSQRVKSKHLNLCLAYSMLTLGFCFLVLDIVILVAFGK